MIKSRYLAAAAALACTAPLVAAQTATARTATARPADAGSRTAVRAPAWQQVGDGITSGISGMAVIPGPRAGSPDSHAGSTGSRAGSTGSYGGSTGSYADGTDLLVARDNKEPGENRLAVIHLRPGDRPQVRPLAWKGSKAPADLEALDAVPGRTGEYVALTSAGKGYHLRLDTAAGVARTLGTFTVPGASEDDNYEGFALSSQGHRLVAVWADRGEDDRPGTLHAAGLDLARRTFAKPVTATFRAPYPAAHVRHISDVKISASGALKVSSASDHGDDGPFDSAVYDAGRVTVDRKGTVRLSVRRAPESLGRYTGHKIEALACLPHSRRGVLGTDDENAGGALRIVSGGLC
ncbi:hypothetical protein A6A06_23855 [Streptomyces sp. CB02923]|uniref:hypothetical protein n=1 Tax=Streptomyces sp. CB02923 TaxID=1718985 RepID=UPI0009397FA7|nr:hypothetical protein [Streptomyces sp. CB02923]OKI00196.1 hypothetical protein A6A06_23855 [Streptomyces sp. CB02923]